MQNVHFSPSARGVMRRVLVGAAFLGAVAVLSLPAARGAGPVGWMPMWLLGMPLAGLAALALAELAAHVRTLPAPAPAGVAVRRRARPVQARRRRAADRSAPRRRAGAPAAA